MSKHCYKEGVCTLKKYAFTLLIGVLCFSPFIANAHVKWFTELEPEKVPFEQILSIEFILLSLLIALFLALLSQFIPLLMKIPGVATVDAKLDGYRKYSALILKYGTAIALILQVVNRTMFAPEFVIHDSWQMVIMWVVIVLLVIPHHFATKIAAVLMLGLFLYIWSYSGWFHMLDYGFYLAIIGVFIGGKNKMGEGRVSISLPRNWFEFMLGGSRKMGLPLHDDRHYPAA